MRVRSFFHEAADERGWNQATQVELLLTFIESESGTPALAFINFINRVIVEEDDMSVNDERKEE